MRFPGKMRCSMLCTLNRILLSLLVASIGVAARTELPAGILYPTQAVYLNETEIDVSSTITKGDVIRTKERGVATLQFADSVALIPPESVVRLEEGWLALDTGTISMKTGREVRPALPENLKIAPSV